MLWQVMQTWMSNPESRKVLIGIIENVNTKERICLPIMQVRWILGIYHAVSFPPPLFFFFILNYISTQNIVWRCSGACVLDIEGWMSTREKRQRLADVVVCCFGRGHWLHSHSLPAAFTLRKCLGCAALTNGVFCRHTDCCTFSGVLHPSS